ncbi:MAG: RnfABCDGE type electron transport complex subunit C [Clostridia bacterium]|nr:RnfABCDGE type electron transport complex subunit C [Clostridia bacterium]
MSSKEILTFKGGVAFGGKAAADIESVRITPPHELSISLLQYGCTGQPCVSVGDRVLRGQCISEGAGDYPRAVFSSVSGNVCRIDKLRCHGSGTEFFAVVIENDGKESSVAPMPHRRKISETSPDEIAEKIRNGGIIGDYRDFMPLYAIISRAVGSLKLKRLIVNCTECSPETASVRRLLLESPSDVINGTKILLRALGLPRADIAVDESDPDAVNSLHAVCVNNPLFRFRLIKSKYPAGDSRILVNALTGREIPAWVRMEDAGYVVADAAVCAEVFRLFADGVPYSERRVTVGGDLIPEPKNLIVPLGTPVKYIIENCGGTVGSESVWCEDLLRDGVSAVSDGYVSAVSSAVFAFRRDHNVRNGTSGGLDGCLRCGKCAAACPMRLIPVYIAENAASGNLLKIKDLGLADCIGCGVCSYVCPSRVDLMRYLHQGKRMIADDGHAELKAGSNSGEV